MAKFFPIIAIEAKPVVHFKQEFESFNLFLKHSGRGMSDACNYQRDQRSRHSNNEGQTAFCRPAPPFSGLGHGLPSGRARYL